MLTQNTIYLSDLDSVISGQSDWSALDGRSFLIIGASGMIGTFFIDVLMRRNFKFNAKIEVFAMGRNKEHLLQRFSHYQNSPMFHFVVANVTKALPDELQTDYIINAASNTHPRAYATDPIGTITTNFFGNDQVLKHAVTHPTQRILFLSSVEVYGENRGDVTKFPENYSGYLDSNTLRAGYPESKRVSEALCQAYISKYHLNIVIPRLSRVFGPSMKLNDSKASSQFILKAVNKENIILKSQGSQYYSYAYVADVVSALLFLLVRGKNGEAYNVANPELDIHLKDFAGELAKVVNRKVVYNLPDATELAGYSKVTKAVLDTKKINKLGWEPLFGREASLKHTIEILRSELEVNAKD
ncbi:dTDP-glucose 4,6-dehydratase [Lacticaseibacillus rhamnosus]|uniref:NAD-dependent epimerase/dehydratase family protein n=1 Tax=Lacticaseibacillus rhamnosus TaxID=47715 RepID=UPI0007E178BE|nr:NAD-dependent epimerase/dehydratase family protein [Lacticaseibacillus rhamnosus]OAU48255.1 dTDP-glucose 4,6-dehydratase [Lacticaseibacillus rhamnosus]